MQLRYPLLLQPIFGTSAAQAMLLALAFTALAAVDHLSAQTTSHGNWASQAESRFQAIYDRGEFRPKSFRPTWLSDSSGFVVETVTPETKQPTKWYYDASSGEGRAWTSADKSPPSDDDSAFRIETRDGKLVAIPRIKTQGVSEGESRSDQNIRQEIVLASSPADRDVEYRNPRLSPDGTRVVFIEADTTDVRHRAVLVPSDPSYPGVQQHRFARVGEAIEKLRVGVVNIDGEQLHWLPIECPMEGMYLGQVEWAGNSNEVLVEKFSRFRDKREFLLVSTSDQVKTVYAETNEAWVESSQGKNSGLVWIADGQEFVVISEKDGWRHAYRYSRDGKELQLLTPGDYDIIERATIDEVGGWYYFYASPQDATQKYLFRVPLKEAGKAERISPENQVGTHGYVFSPNARWAIHTYSTLNTPPVHSLIEVDSHRVVCTLEDNPEIVERMRTLEVQPAEFLKVDIGSGIVFDTWMLKPKNFDATKKYPLFIYVYGEPHAQTVLNEWGAAQIDFHRVVAEQGYIVVSIDNRGTPAPKGAAWRRAIYGSLGPLSTDEQEAGLQALAKQCPFIDLSRVGIWGWSGGGSNTLNALFRKPDSYQVGIAVVPKPQPHLYNAWFQEIYMRDRAVNPAGYERSAPINFAQGLKGKLLIITGSGETNTHIQIIEGLVDKLVALGKPFDYMVYPNRDHGLREGDGTLVHVRMRILRYLQDNLPAGSR